MMRLGEYTQKRLPSDPQLNFEVRPDNPVNKPQQDNRQETMCWSFVLIAQ